jgi:uncharacterized caspase-like protein
MEGGEGTALGGNVMVLARTIMVLTILLLCELTPAYCGKRVALVLGNGAYKSTAALPNSRNDAQDMAAALQKLGFAVILGADLSRVAMDRKILEFSEALTGADAAVFFYSGHSLQAGSINYLVPVDAKAKDASALDFEMQRLQAVQQVMESKAKVSILFLDACRDNPLARNLGLAAASRLTDAGRGLASVETGAKGTLISFSTQPGNVALDGAGRNSPYTGALMEWIGTPGEDIESILKRVRKAVLSATEGRQKPWEHSALVDKFYFNPAPPAQEVSQAVPRVQEKDGAEIPGTMTPAPFSAAEAASIEQIRNAPAEGLVRSVRPRESDALPVLKILLPLLDGGWR